MASFCKQCTDDLAPPNIQNDFIHINDCEPNYGYPELCEECGPTLIGNGGVCLYHDEHIKELKIHG